MGSTKPGRGVAGIFPETSETPIDCRLTARCDESDPMVRFFWRIAFFAFATSVFAGERLNALVTAAQEFSVAIQRQLAAVQGDISVTRLVERTVSYALRSVGQCSSFHK